MMKKSLEIHKNVNLAVFFCFQDFWHRGLDIHEIIDLVQKQYKHIPRQFTTKRKHEEYHFAIDFSL